MKAHSALKLTAAGVALAAALIGCAASPPVQYYTLVGPATTQATPGGDQAGGAAPYLLVVTPVNVPPQADQPQIMMRQPDGSVAAYYSDRWTAPLPDEIRGALSAALVRDLGVLDVQSITAPASAPVWRVQVDVQRFEAVAGGAAVVDATWRIRPENIQGGALLCRSVVQVFLGGSAPAQAVTALRQATVQLASTIATGIRAHGRHAQASGEDVRLSGCVPS
jgi:uncharacterized lipoprotein YmbA